MRKAYWIDWNETLWNNLANRIESIHAIRSVTPAETLDSDKVYEIIREKAIDAYSAQYATDKILELVIDKEV